MFGGMGTGVAVAIVVLGIIIPLIIALVTAVAVPSIIGIFNAGADAQAYNLLAAQLTDRIRGYL